MTSLCCLKCVLNNYCVRVGLPDEKHNWLGSTYAWLNLRIFIRRNKHMNLTGNLIIRYLNYCIIVTPIVLTWLLFSQCLPPAVRRSRRARSRSGGCLYLIWRRQPLWPITICPCHSCHFRYSKNDFKDLDVWNIFLYSLNTFTVPVKRYALRLVRTIGIYYRMLLSI